MFCFETKAISRDGLDFMENWYILFVKTGYEERIVSLLNDKMDISLSKAFFPKKEIIFRRKSIDNKNIEILFPGYVFIETTKTYMELNKEIHYLLNSLREAYRFLYYEDKNDAALHEDEKNEIISLCGDDNYCLKNSVGIIVGDKVKILDGALKGRETTIKKVNRHKRQAIIEMMLFGNIREISVALEIIDRI